MGQGNTSALSNGLKAAFNVVALAIGGAGTVLGSIALLTGGASSANETGGVDLTIPAVAFTLAAAGLFYAGYRGVKNSAATKKEENKTDNNSPEI